MRIYRMPGLLWVIAIIGVILVGCKPDLHQVIIDTFDDGSPQTVKYFDQEVKVENLVKEVQFYPDGTKKYEGHYRNGEKHGKWVFWFDNGKVWSEGYFEHDIRTGKAFVYHKNGQLYYQGKYSNGKKEGVWKFYNNQGQIENVVTYKNGIIVGKTPDADMKNNSGKN